MPRLVASHLMDGVVVSANVTCNDVYNYYTSFTYSDHCPVVVKFTLN